MITHGLKTENDDLDEMIADFRKDPGFREEYDRSRPEFELRAALIAARLQKGLTQEQLAERMRTKQSVVSRIEQGSYRHRLETLLQLSAILDIRFEIAGGALRVVPAETAAGDPEKHQETKIVDFQMRSPAAGGRPRAAEGDIAPRDSPTRAP